MPILPLLLPLRPPRQISLASPLACRPPRRSKLPVRPNFRLSKNDLRLWRGSSWQRSRATRTLQRSWQRQKVPLPPPRLGLRLLFPRNGRQKRPLRQSGQLVKLPRPRPFVLPPTCSGNVPQALLPPLPRLLPPLPAAGLNLHHRHRPSRLAPPPPPRQTTSLLLRLLHSRPTVHGSPCGPSRHRHHRRRPTTTSRPTLPPRSPLARSHAVPCPSRPLVHHLPSHSAGLPRHPASVAPARFARRSNTCLPRLDVGHPLPRRRLDVLAVEEDVAPRRHHPLTNNNNNNNNRRQPRRRHLVYDRRQNPPPPPP